MQLDGGLAGPIHDPDIGERYHGLRHMQVAGTEGDYLHLEYQDGDRLYVPVDRITVVQRYVSADGGDNWAPIVRDLPSVVSVEVQTLP